MTQIITHTPSIFSTLMKKGGELLSQTRARMETASAKRNKFNQTYAELVSLNDKELSDIGIARSQIRAIAREAADMV